MVNSHIQMPKQIMKNFTDELVAGSFLITFTLRCKESFKTGHLEKIRNKRLRGF